MSEEAARKGIQAALDSFNAMVIAPALRRVSERQFQYLAAMAQCEGVDIANGDIAKKMGLSANKVGSYRKRLIDAGLLAPAGYGGVSFVSVLVSLSQSVTSVGDYGLQMLQIEMID